MRTGGRISRQALLAVDGGASCSRAMLVRGDTRLFAFLLRGLNPSAIGMDEFEVRFAQLVEPLLKRTQSKNLVAGVALAGASDRRISRECKKAVGGMLRSYVPRVSLAVMTDIDVLEHIFLRDGGIAVIAGSGSVCIGVNGGKRAKAGGWGGFLDRGCGLWIGLKMLREALRLIDRGDVSSPIVELVMKETGFRPDDSGYDMPKEKIASIARLAFSAYHLGDSFARKLVKQTSEEIVDLIWAVWRKLNLRGSHNVYASGGMFREDRLRRLVRLRLLKVLPEANLNFVNQPLVQLIPLVLDK